MCVHIRQAVKFAVHEYHRRHHHQHHHHHHRRHHHQHYHHYYNRLHHYCYRHDDQCRHMTIITFSSPPSQLSTIFLYIDLTEPCYSFPCLNGGTCIREKLEQFTCQCHRWFEGNTCERGNT